MRLLEFIAYLFVRALVGVLAILPQSARIAFFESLFRFAFLVLPRLKKNVAQNLRIAFPDRDEAWRREIARRNVREMARLLADTVRLPYLSDEWVKEHVSIPILDRYRATLQEAPSRGIVVATGHLGSFELLGHAVGAHGLPLAAVARRFKSRRFDAWWTGLREARGNKIIDRRGAFKEMIAFLSSGISVAVLFDQNVTRNHAVFVDWFGTPAATTKSVALAALRTEAPIFVASIRYQGRDRYEVEAEECSCLDVYHDNTLSTDEKVAKITQRLASSYCEMIRSFPEGWFWLHRRWKTRPLPTDPSLY